VEEVFISLKSKIGLARRIGAENIWADVGIGFGKTLEHNLELLRNLDYFHKLDVPLALGISRKAFIGKILNIDDAKQTRCRNSTFTFSFDYKNIDIIRVHNVKYLNQFKNIE
jgi:dihydropteroate synthase